jgi:UDPglucose 6-dehydrogenase
MGDGELAVGIIGVGTVGGALVAAFDGRLPMYVRDPELAEASRSMPELVDNCHIVFVAVPTPSAGTGDANLTTFHEVLREFIASGGDQRGAPVLCVKSAVPPNAIRQLQLAHPALRLVVSPEFLRQRSPVNDMLAMRSLVLGGSVVDCAVVEHAFREHSNITGPMRTSPGLDAVGAAFLKYQENCFLAAKVSFMNEFFDLFEHCGSDASWEALQTAFHMDHERMGTTHWQVPGPDGQRGWGGHCLPKDLSATRAYAERNGIPTPLLDAVWQRNLTDRPRTQSRQDVGPICLTQDSLGEPRPGETR